MEVQMHQCGTKVVIEHNTIGTCYPPDTKPREVYSLDAEWVKKFTICRVCGKSVDESVLARAYWRLEAPVCSTECLCAEALRRYACCPKATRVGCVCAYAITCPDHGQQHFGTHD